MASIDWEFGDNGRTLVAPLDCSGEPRVESGKHGWYQVSDHIPWRLNWRLQIRCLITELKQDYKLKVPVEPRKETTVDPQYCGRLNIDQRRLTVSFRVPDCLDPPQKKSFIRQGPIFLVDRPFHCQVKLVIIDPKDGSYLLRVAATPTRVGGVQFVSSRAGGERVLAHVCDSDSRGRWERIESKAKELWVQTNPREKSSFFEIRAEAKRFVDSHPSE